MFFWNKNLKYQDLYKALCLFLLYFHNFHSNTKWSHRLIWYHYRRDGAKRFCDSKPFYPSDISFGNLRFKSFNPNCRSRFFNFTLSHFRYRFVVNRPFSWTRCLFSPSYSYKSLNFSFYSTYKNDNSKDLCNEFSTVS